ncbi:hypothetical protein AOLI_G00029380 [Acnodon oligacanthus]
MRLLGLLFIAGLAGGAAASAEQRPPLIEGDIVLPPGRNALINTAYRWTFPIPYILSDSLDLNAKGTIFQGFEVYRLKSCVDFKPYEGEKAYIKFEKRDGCFSSVGMQPSGQVLSLGPGCDHKAIVEHELLHALGFYHMQSRQDRDDYVKIWLDQVTDADDDKTWKIVHVPMEVGVKFRYAFQGVKGDPNNSGGGIFIDDISLSETRCPSAVWRIQNFSQIMETANHDTFLDSPRFYSPEGYAFGIRVYPLSSHTDYTGNYTGLYFHLASGENDVVMQWPAVDRQATLVVMDQDPDIKLRMSSARSLTTDLTTTTDGKLLWDNPTKVGTYDPTCQCYRGESRGWRNFIKHFDLRRRNYLKNDDLIIFADFEDLTPLKNSEVPVATAE